MIASHAELREHLRLTAMETSHDAMLGRLLAAAHQHIEAQLGFAIEARYGAGEDQAPIPAPLRLAVIQLAAYWFDHGEAIADGRRAHAPFGVREIIDTYRDRRMWLG